MSSTTRHICNLCKLQKSCTNMLFILLYTRFLWHNSSRINAFTKPSINVDDELDNIKSSSQLEGHTLSEEAIQRCRLVLEGILPVDEAIADILREK